MYTLLIVALSCLLQTGEMDWKQQTLTVAEAKALTSINDLLPEERRLEAIETYEITIAPPSGPTLMIFLNNGLLFIPEVKEVIENCQPKTTIYFDNIRRTHDDGTVEIFNITVRVLRQT